MTKNRAHPLQRGKGSEPETAPVVLPHLMIRVSDFGELTAIVDGKPVDPPPTGAWKRGQFGDLLDLVTHDRTVTVRIEVHESDGTTFTDLIRARRRTPPPIDQPTRASDKHTVRRRSTPVEITAEGFVPGEQVMVAVVTATTVATSTGCATAAVKPKEARDGEVVLIGRVSETVCIRRPS